MSRWSIIEHPRLKPSALVSYSCTEIPDEKPKRWRSPKPLRRRTRRGPRRRGQPLCRAEPGATFSKLVQNLFAMIEARWLLFLHRNTGRKPKRWRSPRPLRQRARRGDAATPAINRLRSPRSMRAGRPTLLDCWLDFGGRLEQGQLFCVVGFEPHWPRRPIAS